MRTEPTTGDAHFAAMRPRLLGAAYRIVGTHAEAEDVVQDAWLRWRTVDPAGLDDARAYLFRLVTNAALDHLRRTAARREAYVGPWLPEPIPTPAGRGAGAGAGASAAAGAAIGPGAPADPAAEAELAESLSLGLLRVLQALAPAERAVFVLHEAFGLPYAEVAAALGRTEHAVRQVAYRARTRVRAERPRRAAGPGPEAHEEVVRRFTAAALGGDLAALLEVLAPDVAFWGDSDGRSEMPRRGLHGADEVAAYVAAVAGAWPADRRAAALTLNHGPGVLVTSGGAPFLALGLEVDATGRVTAVHAVRNPAKLVAVAGPPLGPSHLC
jgi:RNA polymerase sigma-70 factor (ECF subfamily)